MKLTVLLDNNTLIDRYFLGEPGVSYYLQADGLNVLFDAGYSDAFIRNAARMGIDLLDLDYVVLSHGHLDHTWGLEALVRLYAEARGEKRRLKAPVLLAHHDVFCKRVDKKGIDTGSLLGARELGKYFRLELTREPRSLSENLVFLGEIPRNNDFEAQKPVGKILLNGGEKDDYMLDDTALAYRSQDGLVVVSGCSHSGICNIIEHARKVLGGDRIAGVIGGLHLMGPESVQLLRTVEFFRELKPGSLHACHCTDLNAKIALAGVAAVKEVGVGLELEY
jgi:7,8-dihydropterin-6-yl-methyl-4-(beta-D-ribofuranosyl)aminobenzene 5'-phosphate synthase